MNYIFILLAVLGACAVAVWTDRRELCASANPYYEYGIYTIMCFLCKFLCNIFYI